VGQLVEGGQQLLLPFEADAGEDRLAKVTGEIWIGHLKKK